MNSSHSKTIQDHLCFLWENELFWDLLITHNETIISKAHKIVLGAFSKHLHSLLPTLESQHRPDLSFSPVQELKLDDFDKDNINLIVRFLYTGNFEKYVFEDAQKCRSILENAKELELDVIVQYLTRSDDDTLPNSNIAESPVADETVQLCHDSSDKSMHDGTRQAVSDTTEDGIDHATAEIVDKTLTKKRISLETIEQGVQTDIDYAVFTHALEKNLLPDFPVENSAEVKYTPKRKRGRPRKEAALEITFEGKKAKAKKKKLIPKKARDRAGENDVPKVTIKTEICEEVYDAENNEQDNNKKPLEVVDFTALKKENGETMPTTFSSPDDEDGNTEIDEDYVDENYNNDDDGDKTYSPKKANKIRKTKKLFQKRIRKSVKKIKISSEPKTQEPKKPKLITSEYLQEDGTYKCKICERIYMNANCFRRHMKREHDPNARRYRCTWCPKAFTDKYKLNEHFRVHTGERPFVCKVCGFAFKAKKHINKHMKLHNSEDRVPCTYEDCKITFVDNDQKNRHIRTVHLKLKPFKCDHPGCSYAASDNSMLKCHKQVHLPMSQRKTNLCNICGASIPGPKTNLNVHMIKHGNEWHTCMMCDYKTKYKLYLQSHILRRHGFNAKGDHVEKTRKCPHCAFSCYFKHEFNFHLRKHAIDKPFKCKLCDYSCITQSQMNAHMRTHTGSKPYTCEFCGKGFTQSTHLSRHRRTHTGERPHICKECGQGFIEKRYLERHMYSQHLGIKPYMCHVCTYACIKRDTLKNHIKSAHGVDALPANMRGVQKQKILVKDLPYEQQLDILGEEGLKTLEKREKIKQYEPRTIQTQAERMNISAGSDEKDDSIQSKIIENISKEVAASATSSMLPVDEERYQAEAQSSTSAAYSSTRGHDRIHSPTEAPLQLKRPVASSGFHPQHSSSSLAQHHSYSAAAVAENTFLNLPQAPPFPVNFNLQNSMVPGFFSLSHSSAAAKARNIGQSLEAMGNIEGTEYMEKTSWMP